MVGNGHRVYSTQALRVTKVIAAPLPYVYTWCTDYRSDDGKLSKRRPRIRYRVLRLSPRRLVRVRVAPRGREEPYVAVDVLRFDPPRAWHTDQIDEDDRMTIDYQLSRLGPRRTRLVLRITERYVTPKFPTPAETRRRVNATWDRLAAAVETRYRSGRPALG